MADDRQSQPDTGPSGGMRGGRPVFSDMRRSVVAVSALVWSAILVVVVCMVWGDYGMHVAAGERHVLAVNTVLSTSMRSAFGATQSVMRATADRMRLSGPNQEGLSDFLQRIAGQLPMVQRLLVADASGRVIGDAHAARGAIGLDVSDRECFQAHTTGNSSDVYLARPIISRIDGRPALPMSLSVRSDSGQLMGVVVAGLDPEYFRELFKSLATEGRLDAALFRADGATLVFFPHDADAVGRTAGGVAVFAHLRTRSESPIFHSAHGLTIGPAILACRRLHSCPAVVVCSLARHEALADFTSGLWRPLVVLAVTALVLLIGGRTQVRQARELTSQAQELRAAGASLESANTRLADKVRQHRDAEEALRASERLFREAVDNYPAVFLIYGADRRIRFVNACGVSLTGMSERDMIGCRDEEIHPPEVTAAYVPALEAALASGVVQTVQTPLALRTGQYILDFMFVPLTGEGGAVREILGIAHDITERERGEQARRDAEKELETQRLLRIHSDRLRALGQMAAGIAHELNQPLVGVRGMAEHHLIGLERGWDVAPDRLRYRLQTIVEQVDRMTHIIKHVRMFAREAGKPEFSRVDVNDVVMSANDMLGSQSRSRGIDLRFQLAEDLPPALANPFSLEEVLINLLLNARDAVESKREESGHDTPSRVVVRTECGPEKPGDRVILTVIDSGVGMSADQLDRAFDPFYTTKQPDKGTGLGLSICGSIVEQFGGTIDLKSTLGRGTVVTVSLPAVRREAGDG